MVNVIFYCRKSKVNRKGLSPIEMSIIINGQHLNILAKKMGKELGISVPLHSHLCRHQYITMLIRKGVPLSMVKRCVGHSDIAMTERYLSLTVDDVVEAVSNVL